MNPATVMCIGLPERIAEHTRTARFVPFRSEVIVSFLKNPLDATRSSLEDAGHDAQDR